MIGLTIQRYEGNNPFFDHPELHSIWPQKLALIAEQSMIEQLAIRHTHDIGDVYLIKVGERVIGITGYFPYHGFKPKGAPCDTTQYGLRWHGILHGYRSYGYSKQAISLVAREIEKANPDAEWLIELLPCDETGERAAPHFMSLGFAPHGPREKFDWYQSEWQPMWAKVEHLANPELAAGTRSFRQP